MSVLDHLKTNSRKIEADMLAFNAQISKFADDISDAATDLAHAEREHGDDHEAVAPFRAALRKLKQARAKTKRPAVYDPLSEVEPWAARNSKAERMEPVTADIRRGETPLMAYNRAQAATAAILKTIRGTETAPEPADAVRSSVIEQLKTLAKPPEIQNGRLALPKKIVAFGNNAVAVDDTVGLLVWAIGGELLKSVESLVPEDSTSLSAADRKAALDKAYGELADALRQECACAMAAEQAGLRVQRRRGVHPAIILGAKVPSADVYRYLAKGA